MPNNGGVKRVSLCKIMVAKGFVLNYQRTICRFNLNRVGTLKKSAIEFAK